MPIDELDFKAVKTKFGELRELVRPFLTKGLRRKRKRIANPVNFVSDTDSD